MSSLSTNSTSIEEPTSMHFASANRFASLSLHQEKLLSLFKTPAAKKAEKAPTEFERSIFKWLATSVAPQKIEDHGEQSMNLRTQDLASDSDERISDIVSSTFFSTPTPEASPQRKTKVRDHTTHREVKHARLIAEEKAYRRQHGLCGYCGGWGHFKNACRKANSKGNGKKQWHEANDKVEAKKSTKQQS